MTNSRIVKLAQAEAEAIIAHDLDPNLPTGVRDVLLDVVLAWANLDMATAFFVASVSGLNPDDGADKFGRREIAEKLKLAAGLLEGQGHDQLATKVREIATDYPQKALYRRRIAHTKCAGVRKSAPSRLVFLPFEREGPPGHLAMEVYEISLFADAIAWAREVHDLLIQYVDQAGFFEEE